ncbi:MAG: ABC transporter ATP-binding protein [Thermoplasmataceae archaeon]
MSVSVSINDLSKKYGENIALDNVNLSIDSGQVFGILGPNGSGKTTILRIICSILTQTSGKVSVLGFDTLLSRNKVKSSIGYVPETPLLYESLTPMEYFSFLAAVRNIDKYTLQNRVDHFSKAFDIEKLMNDLIGSLSFGTKQKVAIIGALLHDPDIIILDEGMNGLDPRSAKILKDLLSDLASRGKTVIFSTHILEVAENVCDRIAILYQGNIVAVGTITDLKESSGESGANLEDIFLRLTGNENLHDIVSSLKDSLRQ